ncbi:hypothetical protein ACROYT_G042071 [Oculina patagonica]
MHASTKGSFIYPTLEGDTRPLKQEKREGNAAEKEASRVNAAQGSNRVLLVLVITMCLISLAVLLLTLLMLFGKIGDGCRCSADEASSTESAKKEAFEKNITSLLLNLIERIEDLEKFKIKEKIIYHQTMTPSWLVAHASYINSYRLNITEQLTFTADPSEDDAALLKVPMIPANVLHNSTKLTVKIVVCNDVDIGENEDSDPMFGISDGISFVGFWILDRFNYHDSPPCFGIEGSSGTIFKQIRQISRYSSRPSDTFYPGQFVITLKLDAHESWGSCYTAHDGGLVETAGFNSRLVLSNGLTLEVYKDGKDEKVGIKFIEVTVVEDI